MNAALKSAWSARWQALQPRERLAVWVAMGVVAVGLLWWVLLSPALQTLRAADAQRVALERQHQAMLALQAEARGLQAQPRLSPAEAQRALEHTVRQTLGSTAQLQVAGERATVTIKAVGADTLAQWLTQARVNARALPTEAKLTRTPGSNTSTAATWDGTVVLRLP